MTTIPELLREQARVTPEREFLRFEGAGLTVEEVDARTEHWAQALGDLGVRRGDRVALMLPNGLEYPLAWLAVVKTGAVVVPVNIGFGESDLGHVLRDSGARLVLADPAYLDLLGRVCSEGTNVDLVCRLGPGEEEPVPSSWPIRLGPARDEDGAREGEADEIPDGVVTIQYTSGTTGFPKGCVLTHGYWLELAGAARDICGLGPDDVALTAQPFYYMDPVWNLVLCLRTGMPLVILPRFSATTFWRSAKENGVTFFYCIGTMPLFLLKQPADPEVEREHRVRKVLCSGIPPQHHARLEARYGCPWREVYGSTELGCVLSVPFSDTESVGSGAMGAPVPGREAKVVDEIGEAVPPGGVGELLARGGETMLGYFGLLEETARWRREGWARTGDLVEEDDRGYYRIVGRLKDMIRRGGENIAAAEVEAALSDHPAVRAAACVPVPDEERGEEVKAYVQLRAPHTPAEVSPDALLAFARRKLAAYKIPRYIQFVEHFPLTPSHRVAKQQLIAAQPDLRAGSWDTSVGRWLTID
jgi:crotonobetaine/carnitine-CoA ligase